MFVEHANNSEHGADGVTVAPMVGDTVDCPFGIWGASATDVAVVGPGKTMLQCGGQAGTFDVDSKRQAGVQRIQLSRITRRRP